MNHSEMTDLIWEIPRSVMNASLIEMARDGCHGNEGIAFWLGTRDKNLTRVTHVVGLRGQGVVRAPLYLNISPALMNDLADLSIELGVFLVGQIHAHPGTFMDLSETDITYGIRVPGFISVVAPHYGTKADTRLEECGIHLFESDSGFRRLDSSEMSRRINFDAETTTPFLTIGSNNEHKN